MSRSGYSDDCDDCDGWALIRWRGAVKAAIKGKRGQAMLRELRDALDALPEKSLTTNELEADGEFCTLGALGRKRGVDMAKIDPEDRESVAGAFGIAEALAAEIMYENDGAVGESRHVLVQICGPMLPGERHGQWMRVPNDDAGERRWRYMRDWVESHIQSAAPPTGEQT